MPVLGKVPTTRIFMVGDRYVEFVTEDVLMLTDNKDEAGGFSPERSWEARALIEYHLRKEKDKNVN
jgi:hypothetical protein